MFVFNVLKGIHSLPCPWLLCGSLVDSPDSPDPCSPHQPMIMDENYIVTSDSADILCVSDEIGSPRVSLFQSYFKNHRVLGMEIDYMVGC